MTQKETDGELLEIFQHKSALTDKINWNTKELLKIEIALEDPELKDPSKIVALRISFEKGNKLLAEQITERTKVSFPKIAKELGMHKSCVYRRYIEFLTGKRSSGAQGLSLKKQLKTEVLITASRENDKNSRFYVNA